MNKVGIIGGTFDPIHFGHLIAAQWAKDALNLEQVIFIPAAEPPHKDVNEVSDKNYRFNMVSLAIRNNAGFILSDLEIRRSGNSYTVDTLKHFRQLYPQAQLFFIMGLDALLQLDTWKDVEVLIELATFVVATRPGYKIEPDDSIYNKLPRSIENKVIYLEIPGVEISSSLIRQRLRQGKSIKYLVPAAVENYIYDNNIYGEVYDKS